MNPNETREQVKSGIDTAAGKAKELTDRAAAGVQGAQRDAQRAGNNLGGQAQDAKAAAAGTVEQVKDAAQGAYDAAGRYVGQAADAAKGYVGQARGSVEDWAGQARHFAVDTYGDAGDKLGDLGSDLTTMVRRNPIPALLIAFGAGLLLGRVARA